MIRTGRDLIAMRLRHAQAGKPRRLASSTTKSPSQMQKVAMITVAGLMLCAALFALWIFQTVKSMAEISEQVAAAAEIHPHLLYDEGKLRERIGWKDPYSEVISAALIADMEHGERCDNCVPKIIHHTYKTADLPPAFLELRKECKKLHPDYTFMLWTDDSARQMIAELYGPAHLQNFDSYSTHNIQRADVLRYYALHAYGGIYADLNVGCPRPWDKLRQFPAVLGRANGIGVTNDFMVSAPRHPFFGDLITNLANYHRSYVFPSLTVLASTGPLFVTTRWLEQPESVKRQIRTLPREFFGGDNHPQSFIQHANVMTGSWHMWDMELLETVVSAANLIMHAPTYSIGAIFSVCALIYAVIRWNKSQDAHVLPIHDVPSSNSKRRRRG